MRGSWGRRRWALVARAGRQDTGVQGWVFIDEGQYWRGSSAPGGPAGTEGPALCLQQEGLRLQSNRDHQGAKQSSLHTSPQGCPNSWLPPDTHWQSISTCY